jgi:hypothetical protein
MPLLRLLGGSQFRKFCVLAMIILVITVWITCWTQEEQERPQTSASQRYYSDNALNKSLTRCAAIYVKYWPISTLR